MNKKIIFRGGGQEYPHNAKAGYETNWIADKPSHCASTGRRIFKHHNPLAVRKGIELALNTVVIIAILLIVAVVIISFFLGATGKVFGPIANWLGIGIEELNKSAPPILQP